MSLLLLVSLAAAEPATPWFDQGAAEVLVAGAMPDYYANISHLRQSDPVRYTNRLQRGLSLAVQSQQYPELLETWNRKWAAEMELRATALAWEQAAMDERPLIRQELLALSDALYEANLELLAIKHGLASERAAQLEIQIADTEVNLDALVQERVLNAIGE